jgi:hypothetical protein
MRITKLLMVVLSVVAGTTLAGCAVPQPRGKGKVLRLVEPTVKRGYWLYLPEDYVARDGRRADGRKWPLVMTFHGMKPWDNSNPQIREWQEEADRYGYVVCAPDLIVCDTLMPFPARRGRELDKDEQAILAIMDDVFRKTDADPTQVLSTSWSSGGFVAHYMVNRHPERFSCLSTRQSNFNEEIMDPKRFTQYRDMPIGLYYTTNDFGVCKRDTLRAIAWYKRLDAERLESGEVQAFGHERTPEVAADFFARVCGAKPKTPPQKLARIRIDEVPREALAMASPSRRGQPLPPLPRSKRTEVTNYSDSSISSSIPQRGSRRRAAESSRSVLFDARRPEASAGAGERYRRKATGPASTVPPSAKGATPLLFNSEASYPTASVEPEPFASRPTFREYKRPVYTPPERKPRRRTASRRAPRRQASAKPSTPISVEVSATIGVAPLLIDYAVKLPSGRARGSDFLWFDNGIPIGNDPSGQKVLTHAGEHEISVLVVTKDDQELRARTKVTVLAPLKNQTQ